MLKFSDPINEVPLIGPKYKLKFENLGIRTVQDLLYYFPSYYNDTSQISQISDLNTIEKKTIEATIESVKNIRTKGRKFITTATVTDDSGQIDVIWFNQRFLSKTLKVGAKALLYGSLNPKLKKPQLYSPEFEILNANDSVHLGRIVPIYPLTLGITNKWLRARIKFLLTKYPYLLREMADPLPQAIKQKYELISIDRALSEIHFPKDKGTLSFAQRRLSFDELLPIQLSLLKIRKQREGRTPYRIENFAKEVSSFLTDLPYNPTSSQRKVIGEILADFEKTCPTNRLIQGDVGCGKTLVAAAASIPIVNSSLQVAILAPTAILASQHFKTFSQLFKNYKYKISLVTGSTSNKENGDAKSSDIVIGTHALLHRHKEVFNKLGLVVIDEQHRFGVKQRDLLQELPRKGKFPHTITMTATPIPRSIALTLFGDLDISIIDEMPPGIRPTKTYLVPKFKRKAAYNWIKQEIRTKQAQAFWICPLIEESEKLQLRAVEIEYNSLKNKIYPDLRIDFLHGKMSTKEKDEKIELMKADRTDILVSTSVVEVGIDIANARIIVVEGAERFGLAQLHQLRGRVGRRAGQDSWCFLFSDDESPKTAARLKYFATMNDGLKVAEYDLTIRGPGEVYGTKQAGIPDLKIAKLNDFKLIQQTREAAEMMTGNRVQQA